MTATQFRKQVIPVPEGDRFVFKQLQEKNQFSYLHSADFQEVKEIGEELGTLGYPILLQTLNKITGFPHHLLKVIHRQQKIWGQIPVQD